MVVIADTSPLNYLILIDAVDLLPRALWPGNHSCRSPAPSCNTPKLRNRCLTGRLVSRPGWKSFRHRQLAIPSELAELDAGERARHYPRRS